MKRLLKILGYTLLTLLLLCIAIVVAVQTKPVQNWLVGIATKEISKQLGTTVSIKSVDFNLFYKANINGLYVEDKKKDTILYAGSLSVNITDWFFFKQRTELQKVELKDAVIKINRTDSIWNFQYIVNHFASTDTTTKPSSKVFTIKEVALQNLKFVKHDAWRGETITVHANEFYVKADSLNFKKNYFAVNTINAVEPQVNIQSFVGNMPIVKIVANSNTSTAKPENPLQLIIQNFNLHNAQLAINSGFEKPTTYFDGNHILFNHLNANFEGFNIKGSTLQSKLNITAVERSGLQLKKLVAHLKWVPGMMELKNLDLITNKSHITNYYAMKFKNFSEDFDAYATNVTMDAHFKSSIINSDDIAYFSPSLKNWKKELHISGDFLGTVSDFNIKNLVAKEKNNGTTINGQFAMKGLPNIDKTLISFTNGKITTNYTDLSAIVPSLKNVTNPNVAALGAIVFNGNFVGTTSKFNTNGTFTTALGNITTNVNMELPKNGDANYNGEIDINSFNLATFVRESQLGIVDFKGKFSGNSFDINKLKTNLEGDFKRFTYNGYTYTNISTKATLLKKYFNGELKINDPNFHLNGQAEANFTNAQPSFNVLADLTKSNLQTLNFSKNELHLTGLIDVNFTGTNIDNFLGAAKFLNAKISNDKSTIAFDSLTLSTEYVDGKKQLHFASNDFNVDVKGDFKILDLPTSFQSFLHNYYAAYIPAPKVIPKNQNFVVSLTTRYIEPYIQLFNKDIKGFNDVNLTGSINTTTNAFGMNLLLPYGKYKNYVITGAEINGTGNKDSLHLDGVVSNFQVSDSFGFPNTTFNIVSSHDVSGIQLKTAASNTINEANLDAVVATTTNEIKIKFNPSSFILNDKKWNLDKEGEIILNKNYSIARNVKFVQGFQEISVEAAPNNENNTSNLDVKLKDVVVGDLASLVSKGTRIEGLANGTLRIEDIFGDLNASTNITIKELKFADDSVGTTKIDGTYSSKLNTISANVVSQNPLYNFLANIEYNLKDSVKALNSVIDLNNTKVDLVQKLLGTSVFSNLKGLATGQLKIMGKPNSPDLLGVVKLKNAGLKVNFTNVYYSIDSATLKFEDDGIDFGKFTIKDTLGNVGTVSGKLYEKQFKNMFFDFDVASKSMLVLNTSSLNNERFYGNVIANATMNFFGPQENCKMVIAGEPTAQSHITIVNANSKENSDADFIVFKPIGEEMITEKKKSNFNVFVDLDIMANNYVSFDVLLDETGSDVITGKGSGRLRIKVGTNDNLDIRGKLAIDEGSYNFNFQSLIRKPFILRQGANNYIEWNGNPYDAYMHIDAMYEARNVSIKDLIANTQASFNSASKNFRDDVYVIATLTGKLLRPDIDFKFDFPANSPIKNDDVFDRFLKKVEADDNEMIKQVAYLIVFNSFAPYGESSIAQTNFSSIAVNTISSLVTKEINKAFTNLLYKITNDKNLIFDMSSSVYSSSDLFSTGSLNATSQFDRTNIKVKVGRSFFNDKVRINVGGDFDFNLRSSTQTGNFQWLPDWNVQWSLNADRSLALVIFNKNSLDISGSTLGRRTRQGVGITYKKDFDNSLFSTNKEGKRED